MENYIFKTNNNEIGYLQNQENECKLYLDDMIHTTISFYFGNEKKSTCSDMGIVEYINYALSNYDIKSKVEEIQKTNFTPGKYYKRINRTSAELFTQINTNDPNMIDEIRNYNLLNRSLNEIFYYIEPNPSNYDVYSLHIRQIFILACTEIENIFKQILYNNGLETSSTTNDYVKLLSVLRLNEYNVKLNMHPSIQSEPFKDWSSDSPTKSLSWYKDYHDTKHNRSENLNKATLKNLIDAMSAIHILLEAQYGQEIFDFLHTQYKSEFMTIKSPIWSIEEMFFPKIIEDLKKVAWTNEGKYFKDFPD